MFTDPILVTGILSNEEIWRRSSIGFYLYTPEGENEHLLKAAGFHILKIVGVTCQVETVSKRRHTACQQRRDQLLRYEELEQYDALKDFLSMVFALATEIRLSRFAFLAQKLILPQIIEEVSPDALHSFMSCKSRVNKKIASGTSSPKTV